ncbi:hypothetical protein [Streptomyces anulatus]|uniref:hypothetical protein n=2 Tax=Streptomyces anulatus TaxID=1892 RepID=UPI0030E4F3E7|nr:hypothetical protein OG499_26550 [Streptomyces anulatus]
MPRLGAEANKEHIYPKWLIRELRRLGVKNDSLDPRKRKIEWPTAPAFQRCNNNWMSALDNDQLRLALWTAMKAILFDSAGEAVIPRGFSQSLEIFRHPHPGMRVWIAAYYDSSPLALVIRPIYAPQSTKTEIDQLNGWCATSSVLRVAF